MLWARPTWKMECIFYILTLMERGAPLGFNSPGLSPASSRPRCRGQGTPAGTETQLALRGRGSDGQHRQRHRQPCQLSLPLSPPASLASVFFKEPPLSHFRAVTQTLPLLPALSSAFLLAGSFPSFRTQFKCHFLTEAFSSCPIQMGSPLFSLEAPRMLSSSTYHTLEIKYSLVCLCP